MSEEQATYGNPVYQPPTRYEFRVLLEQWELTNAAAGRLTGLEGRQIRRYTGGQTPVPYSVLFVLAVKCEDVQIAPERWRLQLGIEGFEDAYQAHQATLR